MTRKLASIQRITAVNPIPDADAIEAVRVLGWDVVVRKDLSYKPGDLVIYFEIDSVLPDHPAFEEMLRGKPWSPRAARLKTVKLRGQLSQGYVRHVADVLPGLWEEGVLEEGDDVTETIGVTKYEPPLPTDTAAIAGHWLPGVPKTDEDRVQSNPKLVAALQGEPYVITVKLDGMSGTFGYDQDGKFWACSRNFRLKPNPAQPHTAVALRYDLETKLADVPNLVIQGEVCGPGVQGNKLGLTEHDLFVFNIWDTEENEYLTPDLMTAMCRLLGLKQVPLLETGRRFSYTSDELLKMAEGKYESGQEREGIVIRHRHQTGTDRISFKAISNRFLLKGGD